MSSQSVLAAAAVIRVVGGPPDSAMTTPSASPSAIGTASGTISCGRSGVRGRDRRREWRRCGFPAPLPLVFPMTLPLQVSMASTSVHAEYLEGDVQTVPARGARKTESTFAAFSYKNRIYREI